MSNLQQKLVGVFGLGMSGLAAARYLQKTNQSFFVVDTRAEPPGKSELENLDLCQGCYFGKTPQSVLNNASMIIVSPGVDSTIEPLKEAKDSGVEIVGDVEIFARETQGKIIAITGSNGKSTVTDLTYQVLKAGGINAAIGGNFGVPVLDFLPADESDVYVLELSSFQLDTTHSLNAEVATVLNVSEDHMDRYSNFEAYRNSKLTIYQGASKKVINLDDANTFCTASESVVAFSLCNEKAKYHAIEENEKLGLTINDSIVVFADELSITGKHNASNVLATLALITELGVNLNESMLTALKNYRGLAHRFEKVLNKDNCVWINDSKATNVGATLAAINGISDRVDLLILIAGGDAKGGDLSPLKPALKEKVDHLILLGKDANLLADLVPDEKIYHAKNMDVAVKQAKEFMVNSKHSHAMVLLSPACASLDMFANYMQRGDAFVEAVRACA